MGPTPTSPRHDPSDCGSFAPGHVTHWIPALRVQRTAPVGARVLRVEGHAVHLRTDAGEDWRWFHHDPARLQAVAPAGTVVDAYPGLSLLAAPSDASSRHLVSCAATSDAFRPCTTRWRPSN